MNKHFFQASDNILAPQTPAQMARQQDRFARLAARQRELGAE